MRLTTAMPSSVVTSPIMVARKLLPSTSYFAFTATPRNKALEILGEPSPEGGQTKHRSSIATE
jgi:hypothetical protein